MRPTFRTDLCIVKALKDEYFCMMNDHHSAGEPYRHRLQDLLARIQRNDPTLGKLWITNHTMLPLLLIGGALEDMCDALSQNHVIRTIAVDISGLLGMEDRIPYERCVDHLGLAIGDMGGLEELFFYDATPLAAVAGILRGARQAARIFVHLDGEPTTHAADEFASAIRDYHALEKLSLSLAWSDALRRIFCQAHTLQHLHEINIKSLEMTPLDPETSLGLSLAPALQRVVLTELELPASALGVLASSTRCLCCKHSLLIGHDVERFGAALANNRRLVELTLTGCTVSATAFYRGLGQGLQRNRTLQALTMDSVRHVDEEGLDEVLADALKPGLALNHTLRELTLSMWQISTEGCLAMREALGVNEGLQKLTVLGHRRCDGRSWGEILPFLRSNTTLVDLRLTPECLDDVRLLQTAHELQYNHSLQNLSLVTRSHISEHGLVQFVSALMQNTTLRSFHPNCAFACLSPAMALSFIEAMKSNYGFDDLSVHIRNAELKHTLECLCALNKAGRCYLVEEPTSLSSGVRVLYQVRNNLDCLFMHLQENPSLCDRSQFG